MAQLSRARQRPGEVLDLVEHHQTPDTTNTGNRLEKRQVNRGMLNGDTLQLPLQGVEQLFIVLDGDQIG
jgi:hypothetical protein